MSLNNYQIKLLAAILMVIDHIGAVFFPENILFRFIGRYSFPLFIFLLTQGEKHTRSFAQYAVRLLLLGLISQPIYQMVFNSTQRNILFTLFLGLLCLRLVRHFPRWYLLVWLVGGAIAQGFALEYGAYGIVAIALIQRYRDSPPWWIGWAGLHLSLFFLEPDFSGFQFPAILSPLVIRLANYQQGQKARWFYLFYPVHLFVLWLLQSALILPQGGL